MLRRAEGQLSRRDLLKQVGLAGAAIVAMPELGRVLLFRRGLLAQARAGTLTATEFATLDAICARLVPTDENGPGAKEAHAANYIDRALGDALASYRDDYSLGLAAVNVYAHLKQTSARTFADLTADQQDAVLREMEQDVPLGFIPSSARFFNLIRAHTLQDMSTPPKAIHKSAYDYVMFSTKGADVHGH
jgi:hypothetical protein